MIYLRFVGAVMLILVLILFGCVSGGNSNSNSVSVADVNQTVENSSDNSSSDTITYSVSEVAFHNSAADCWMIIDGNVYDLTDYMSHPGGDEFRLYCGMDGTDAYNQIHGGRGHSDYADSLLENYLLGSLK